ncbi:MAG TPA: ABC transporter substrate-binding protein, partial [Nitriliruptorales bacterium]
PPGGEDIRVGFTYFNPAGVGSLVPGSSAQGLTDLNPDAEVAALKREARALVDYANATGGVNGRTLVAFLYELSIEDVDQASRTSKCVRATEDDHVEAYIDNNGFFTETDFQCFADHGVVYVGLGNTTDRRFLEANHPYVNTTYPALDRTVRAFVEGLDASGYLEGARLGVLLDDEPQVRRAYEQVMRPMLTARGAEPVDHAYIHPTDQGAQSSQTASAMLRFKTNDVTHVPLVANVLVYLSFSQAAEQQGYAPRYGFNDYQLMVANGATFKTGSQGVDAVAVSTVTGFFLPASEQHARSASDPVDPAQSWRAPGVRRCLDIYSQHLEPDYGNSPNRSTRWGTYCDHFLLRLDAARAVPGGYSPARWGEGLETLGSGYASTLSYDQRYGPRVHDGAHSFRYGVMSEVDGCACYTPLTQQWSEIGR